MSGYILNKVYGCLIGGAIGDAMGANVEGWNYWEIRNEYGGKLTELIACTRGSTNGLVGGITDDTALRHYIALAVIRKSGRITPDDLAEIWLAKGHAIRLWSNERMVYEKLRWGANPWGSGAGAIKCGTAAMAISPVGIINAGNPAQAFEDGYLIGSVNQDGEERDAAGTLAAAVAAAFIPGANLQDVIEAMMKYSTYAFKRGIDFAMEMAVKSSNVDHFVEKFYESMIDWTWPRPANRVKEIPEGYPRKAKFYSGSSLEMIPVTAALMYLCDGDVNSTIIEGANFGRDCDTIASFAGSILGALHGAETIKSEWVEVCERANVDLFEELEGDKTASFRITACRLVDALRAEKESARRRLEMLEKMFEL